MKSLSIVIFCFSLCFAFYSTTSAEMIKRKQVEPTGQVVWEVPTNKKIIALTFDDGPNPIYTPQVLKLLKKYDAHATFFELGYRIQQYPQITRQVVNSGNELGNHSMTHPYEFKTSVQHMIDDLLMADQIIKVYQPNHSRLFRPPGGYIDNTLLQEIKKLEYKVVLYRQDPKDWSRPGARDIANQVIRHAKNGDIVLLHDGGRDRNQTIQALKIILPTLKKQGYHFVTVTELLENSPQKN